MDYQLICTDIDGTLLDETRELSPRTLATVQALKNSVPFILASSRMPSAMTHLQAQLGIRNSPLICYNGGYVIVPTDESVQVLQSQKISRSICQTIYSSTSKTGVHMSVYTEDDWYVESFDQWALREKRNTKVSPETKDFQELLFGEGSTFDGAHKVMCMGDAEGIDQLESSLLETHSESLHLYRSRPTYLEIADKRISKASGLALLLEQIYQLTAADVLSFGDNYNDSDLLEFSGRGIAVENAREEVKAIADEITLKSIEDGVALSIAKYFS